MRKTLVSGALFILAVVGAPLHAAKYEAGVHYFQLAEKQPVQTGDKIEVLEMFWYGCPHCFRLEPFLEKWLQAMPPNADYVRLPAIMRSSWRFHARVFFAFEALGITDRTHRDFFDELHKRDNRINNLDQLKPFLQKHGVNATDFLDAYDSFAVDAKLRHAEQMSDSYEATGVPTMIIDGKYRAGVGSAGGHEQLLDLINFLVEKSAAER